MARDPEVLAHQEWLGFIQPVGLVVSIPALISAQAFVNRNIVSRQQALLNCVRHDGKGEFIPDLVDFREFTRTVLEWEPDDLLPAEGGAFDGLEVMLPEYQETLKPTYVVPEVEVEDGEKRILMLVQELSAGVSLDEVRSEGAPKWQASPHAKFERLLREVDVPIGLLHNGLKIRLIYAPRGETSGYMTFSVKDMITVAGRPLLAGLHMLLSSERLFTLAQRQRLPAILAESRKYQSTVSTELAEQVLAA
ncbi:MAG: hypothetical protein K8F91_19415, partial [Candidatus Obscuribacterales bacterium]|nr:hypothetical protein [Candidatus Obscuribacterales bacterium]